MGSLDNKYELFHRFRNTAGLSRVTDMWISNKEHMTQTLESYLCISISKSKLKISHKISQFLPLNL